MANGFFDEQRDQSAVKTAIVAKYVSAWCGVMLGAQNRYGPSPLAYVDLFAGPGRYQDGAKSTPLVVLERAIADPRLRDRLVTLFNDRDPATAAALQQAISEMPGIESLAYPPQVVCSDVEEETRQLLQAVPSISTFSFIDPFGYRGLSQGLIQSMIRDWGSDCVIFFNYPRINAGLNNSAVRVHMDTLFGRPRVDRLRKSLEGASAADREALILEELAQSLKDLGGRFVLPFRFRRLDGSRTSHALVFVSKHIRGYQIMKDIMAAASSTDDQGVSSFEYSPADRRCPLLFSLNRPLEYLAGDLALRFAGQTLSVKALFEAHNVDTPFLLRNYQDALRALEEAGRVKIEPPAERRPMRSGKRTLGERAMVTFRSA